jgi:hypothetical protein
MMCLSQDPKLIPITVFRPPKSIFELHTFWLQNKDMLQIEFNDYQHQILHDMWTWIFRLTIIATL